MARKWWQFWRSGGTTAKTTGSNTKAGKVGSATEAKGAAAVKLATLLPAIDALTNANNPTELNSAWITAKNAVVKVMGPGEPLAQTLGQMQAMTRGLDFEQSKALALQMATGLAKAAELYSAKMEGKI